MRIQKLLPGIQRNISLKNYTTFKIGGKAKYFFVAKNKENLVRATNLAKKFKLPFFILGGGSNILVADEGFGGLIIKIQNSKFKIHPVIRPGAPSNDGANSKIYVEAGMPLALVVSEITKNNLTGLEWAVGIPGQVGGAIWGNAGAFGNSMADIIKEVEVLDVKELRLQPTHRVLPPSAGPFKIYDLRDCKFGYRDSIFKHNKDLIILSAVLQLKKGKKSEIEKKVKENLNYRKERQPLNFPSSGSVFKNPRLRRGFGEQAKGFSAGGLIEKCGLKGKKVGNVKISEKHANFIVNLGRGTAKDVMKLIKIIKNKVKKKFGVVLEEEIQFLGF